jgi:hypothetical protein
MGINLKKHSLTTAFILISIMLFAQAPFQTAPLNNTSNEPVNALLEWSMVGGSSKYLYQVDTSITFSSSVMILNETTNSFRRLSSLFYNKKYYWRVASVINSDTTWSGINYFFTTSNLSLTAPNPSVTEQDVQLNLQCSVISGSDRYIYQLDTVSTFNSPAYKSEVKYTSLQTHFKVSNLFYGQKYY